MISGLVQLFLWQGLGELLSKFFLPSIPGPVLGLLLLVAFLCVKGQVNTDLAEVADAFRQHLGLLFVPASVGVVLFLPDLKTHALAVSTALIVSVILTIGVTAIVLKVFWYFSLKRSKGTAMSKGHRHE
ncbi:CidA/LrgA family protein [Methylophilus aquaticus]|uniref:CidA/LrgA family protein n=1 Tax=Methylophilus aquaticus TaxID=1971610 RepID=A0ABT9JTA3_9PROT|nr:CidA/LrgA family protein [Methylophilus aquaticus]MDP8567822.1 CidA/LrgA family protein [Methylophilus aquaticus]